MTASLTQDFGWFQLVWVGGWAGFRWGFLVAMGLWSRGTVVSHGGRRVVGCGEWVWVLGGH